MNNLSLSAVALLKDANIVPRCVVTLHLTSGEDCIAVPRSFTGEGMRATFPDGITLFIYWGSITAFTIRGY